MKERLLEEDNVKIVNTVGIQYNIQKFFFQNIELNGLKIKFIFLIFILFNK